MIEVLKISSMAIFDEMEVEFDTGLNCITGETGAGKSLLIDALTLLMGARASGDIVRPGRDKAVIEALFSANGDESVLRREISAGGRSRCSIDGRLATLAELAQATAGRVSIYGQHQYQDLLNPAQHVRILEEAAGLERQEIDSTYAAYVAAHQALDAMVQEIERLQHDQELMRFHLAELEALDLHAGLEDELSAELACARAAEELSRAAHEALDLLYAGTPSLTDGSSRVRAILEGMARNDAGLGPHVETMDAILAQVEDITLELRDRLGHYEYDPARIADLEARLHNLLDLKRKHDTDEDGLQRMRDDLRQGLTAVEDAHIHIVQARSECQEKRALYSAAVTDFMHRRSAASRRMQERINKDLGRLGMPGTRFEVQQLDDDELAERLQTDPPQTERSQTEGLQTDGDVSRIAPQVLLKAEFLIATNVGQHMLPLARVASGGELSRVMLAIKAQQSGDGQTTQIFDEIDAGISGQTSFMIARRLKDLASHGQAIVITHLHQVASLADRHIVISKKSRDGMTVSRLKSLASEDRVMELARMMGGASPSSAVIEHARELLNQKTI